MPKKYIIIMECKATGKPLYLRDVSWIGQHMTYRRAEAKPFTARESAAMLKSNKRYQREEA